MSESVGYDLLDILNAMDAPRGIHALMPNLATACGLTAFEASDRAAVRGETAYTYWPKEATCPDCLAVGDLDAICRAMMYRQADAED